MAARTGRHLHTIAALGALADAAGILLFLITGSGVAPRRAPGGGSHHRDQNCTGNQRPPGPLDRHPRAERASRRRASSSSSTPSSALPSSWRTRRRARRMPRATGSTRGSASRSSNARSKRRADALYAEQQFAGKAALAADGFASRQDLDQAYAAVGTAGARLDHAQEAYQAARLGPIREELAVADAKVENAEAAVAVIGPRRQVAHWRAVGRNRSADRRRAQRSHRPRPAGDVLRSVDVERQMTPSSASRSTSLGLRPSSSVSTHILSSP